MYDKDFLQWIHDRLEFQYKENPRVDYMLKLKAIINATPEFQLTPNTEVYGKN